jgi:hypothetical protein
MCEILVRHCRGSFLLSNFNGFGCFNELIRFHICIYLLELIKLAESSYSDLVTNLVISLFDNLLGLSGGIAYWGRVEW